MAAHRYWRLNVTVNWTAAYTIVGGMELRTAVGTANLSSTGLGTASASSIYDATYPASKAFDLDDSTSWSSANAAALPQWVKWDFGAGLEKDINYLTLVNGSGNALANVRTATLQYSDNDSSWTNHILVVENPTTISVTNSYAGPSTSTIAVALPMPTCVMYLDGVARPALPTPTVEFRLGDRLEVALPTPAVAFRTGARLEVNLPTPIVRMTGGAGILNTIAVELLMPTAEMRGGARAAAVLPMPTVDMSGTTTILARIEATMPMPAVGMQVTSTTLGSVTARLPMPTVAMCLGGRIAAAMPMPTIGMAGTRGSLISITAVMPMAEVACSITSGGVMQIRASLPMLVTGPWGRITAVMPMAQVSVVARSVVVITYEAYAVNLNPFARRGEEPANEVTHYTNYPFTQIVRYQNSYFGVGPTGVFLLEGTTDAGTPIPWNWKTALGDFDAAEKKTVIAARFAGRVGPAATLTLYQDESASAVKSYTTPRDADPQNYRQKFGRGTKARYYALGMAGEGELELDEMALETNITTRKL